MGSGKELLGCSVGRNGPFLWSLHSGPLRGSESKTRRQGTFQPTTPHVPAPPPAGAGGASLSQPSSACQGAALCPALAADWLLSVGKRALPRPHRLGLHKGAATTPRLPPPPGHPPGCALWPACPACSQVPPPAHPQVETDRDRCSSAGRTPGSGRVWADAPRHFSALPPVSEVLRAPAQL